MDGKENIFRLMDFLIYGIGNGYILKLKNKNGVFKEYLILVGLIVFLSGFCGCFLICGLIVLLIWVVLWLIIGNDVLFGGNIFGIYIVVVFVSFFGFIVGKILYFCFLLLLGMFLVGFLL